MNLSECRLGRLIWWVVEDFRGEKPPYITHGDIVCKGLRSVYIVEYRPGSPTYEVAADDNGFVPVFSNPIDAHDFMLKEKLGIDRQGISW